MRHTTAIRILPVLLLLIAMLGCALTNTLSGIIGGEDVAQDSPTQETIYIIVEGDPTATLAPTIAPAPTITPIPLATNTPSVPGGLVLQPCVDRLTDCPDSSHFITFIELGPPNEESFDMPSNTQLYVTVSWDAVDEATLEDNLANLRFILEIDGQDVFDEEFTFYETRPYILDETQIDSLKTMSATISGWTPQQAHTVHFGYEVLGEINNGRYGFDAGDEYTYILHICPDGGCPLD